MRGNIQALSLYLSSLTQFDPSLQQLVSYIELPLITLIQHFTNLKESVGVDTVLDLLLIAEHQLLDKIVIETSHFERLFEFLLKILFKAEEHQVWQCHQRLTCCRYRCPASLIFTSFVVFELYFPTTFRRERATPPLIYQLLIFRC